MSSSSHHPFVTLIQLAVVAAAALSSHRSNGAAEAINLSESRGYLKSPRLTEWGDWGSFEHCPEHTFVLGMSLKTEPDQAESDDTGLNGIAITCGNLGKSGKVKVPSFSKIHSLTGKWGKWGATFQCPCSYAVGFQLRSQEWQGGGKEGDKDDAAATNLRLYCNASDYLEGDGLQLGNWTQAQFCPPGWVLCGLRTQVETLSEHRHDATGLNNLDMRCCDPSRPSNCASAQDNDDDDDIHQMSLKNGKYVTVDGPAQ